MDIYLLPIFFIGVVADPGADDLAEFSNNLATDVGPLLVLFGESMTKQYLSESTSFLDYFIFAMAPIGLLTAIVSTIRLCGHSSFRAFIGRSQEGRGTVEAELCTSRKRFCTISSITLIRLCLYLNYVYAGNSFGRHLVFIFLVIIFLDHYKVKHLQGEKDKTPCLK
jgi:hypothetical protein